MRPNLTQAQVNHLRRLLGWVRCEYGQEPAVYAEQAKDMIARLEHAGFKTSDDAKAYIAESYMHKASTPKYVRAAVKALEKLLVKQDGVVVDVTPSGHRPPATIALQGHRPSGAEPVWLGVDMGGGEDMTTGGDGWSYRAPTEPGRYLFRSMENNYQAEEVIVTRERRSGGEFLIVDCPHLGKTALPHYHDGLTEPSWKKLENER